MDVGETAGPIRVQRKRTKDWRMPPDTVYVGRPSKWGNPYLSGRNVRTPLMAVDAFEKYMKSRPQLVQLARQELRGKDLACWCSLDRPCQADVLLELANG